VRPENFTLGNVGAPAAVQVVEPTGSELQVTATMGDTAVIAVFRERHNLNPGDIIRLKPDPDLVHLFDADDGTRLNGG
jgi:multiple sugar transport system ATP-binding protein